MIPNCSNVLACCLLCASICCEQRYAVAYSLPAAGAISCYEPDHAT